MKFNIQPIIIAFGILSLGFGIWKMMQTTTMILPLWFLVLFYFTITLGLAFTLAFLIKKILKPKWQILTLASIFVILICSIYYVSQYKPVHVIVVPESYVGQVKLFVSNEKINDFHINKYGIGYIDKETFDNGFYPKILKGDIDITKQVKEYSKGALALTREDVYSYEFLYFTIPMKIERVEDMDINALIKIKAIDTSRLYKRLPFDRNN